MRYCWIVLFLFFNFTNAQSDLPQNYFGKPLDIPLVLSGTFGELRSNHFHSGMDIKTQQRTGEDVLASADGYVSRIKISPWGYGKAVYITHPNGYTTVYAHLKELAPKIEAYVKKRQYEQESFAIELFPEASDLPVSKAEVIAKSGNSGGSGGPHLHFEIRDANARPMNPMLFGFHLEDSKPPYIRGVYAYPLGEEAHVNHSAQRQKLQLTALSDGTYKSEPISACGKISFGIATTDQLDGAYNHNGVYKIEAVVNGNEIVELLFNKFSFYETRYLNHLIDYKYYQNHGSRIQKLFNINNPVSIYKNVEGQGVLNVKDSMSYEYKIKVSDFAGNERIIRIPIEGEMDIDVPQEENKTPYFVNAESPFVFEKNGVDLYIPANSLYEDVYLDLDVDNGIAKLHEDEVAIHDEITLGMDVSQYKPEDRAKLFIGRMGYKGYPIYSETALKDDRLVTEIRTFGDYKVYTDTEPPSVNPVNFRDGQWISYLPALKVKINDSESGIKSYRATVNGEFILMEYDYKTDMLTHYFEDGVVKDTENKFKLIVTDNVGNSTTFESTFFRKP